MKRGSILLALVTMLFASISPAFCDWDHGYGHGWGHGYGYGGWNHPYWGRNWTGYNGYGYGWGNPWRRYHRQYYGYGYGRRWY